MSTVKDALKEERRAERSQLRAVAPLLSVSARERNTSWKVCVSVCVRVCESMRLPANNLTSHGACLLVNFNENSLDKIFLRCSGSRKELSLNVFV